MTGEVSPAGHGERPLAGRPPSAGESAADEPSANGELRASHEDRDGVVEQLRVAAGDGRLTAEELDERLGVALTARTYRELATLTADLPVAPGGVGPLPEARELVKIKVGSGHTKRDGRWVVPQRMELEVSSGHVLLDFTEAVITGRSLQINADIHSGHLLFITKPGIVVDADDVSLASGHVKTRTPWAAQVPEILRIQVSGRVRSGHINARPPRRTFWQWLRRIPKRYPTA